jgi:hypothetical protein
MGRIDRSLPQTHTLEEAEMTYPKAIVIAAALLASAIAFSGRPVAQSSNPVSVAASASTSAVDAWVVIGEKVYYCNGNAGCKKIPLQ